MNGEWSALGWGVLMWECAGSLADGNIFLSVPLDGTMFAFFCAYVCRGSRWPGGAEKGGPIQSPYQGGGLPQSMRSEAPGVEAPLMMGWGSPRLPDGGTWVPVLPRGLLPLLWPKADTDDGALWP